jgi:hypothetical protein
VSDGSIRRVLVPKLETESTDDDSETDRAAAAGERHVLEVGLLVEYSGRSHGTPC